jgi:hypothetical protein
LGAYNYVRDMNWLCKVNSRPTYDWICEKKNWTDKPTNTLILKDVKLRVECVM